MSEQVNLEFMHLSLLEEARTYVALLRGRLPADEFDALGLFAKEGEMGWHPESAGAFYAPDGRV